jgi:hypothetical protein
MTDPEGRLPGELAPSRDPDARRPLPDVDADAREERPEGLGEGLAPFLDAANQNPEVAPRAAGRLPAGDAAPAAVDRSPEDASEGT